MELIEDTIERYRQLYGQPPEVVVTAPARVNLIGEHTDYNDGFVLPVAIDRNIVIAAGARNDMLMKLHSVDLLSSADFSVDSIHYHDEHSWMNYTAGVAYFFQKRKYPLAGANLCIRGNIPIGAGLSSSAAISVASVLALSALNKIRISHIDTISIAQQAETEFVGVQCGIMDQFVSVMGKKNHALFLDCQSLKYEHVPFPSNARLIICDTGSRRELANSAYNRRRAECEDAVRQLAKLFPQLKSLRGLTIDQFRSVESALSPIARQRTLHVVTENDRVLRSVEALKKSDLAEFGRLMKESHYSLKHNYEVSSKELDAFVDIAVEAEGVFGARMTGAGFGGSAICIVKNECVDDLVYRLRTEFPKHAGRSLTIYISSIEDGAITLDPNNLPAPTPAG
jgi:galactokinase